MVNAAVAEVVFASRFAMAISWIVSTMAAANAIVGRCSARGSLMPSLEVSAEMAYARVVTSTISEAVSTRVVANRRGRISVQVVGAAVAEVVFASAFAMAISW